MNTFDNWNQIKKEINAREDKIKTFPKEGEVWMSNFGKNIGFEQDGSGDSFSRPILVIKKFNNQMFWVVPLSTKQKKFDFYHNYIDPDRNNVSVILAQLRLISIKRIKRKLYDFEKGELDIIKNKLKCFL
ncbi:MAG: type II toxin-antitoxin system PemK/MazF family toxin [Candidatus Paceibacterota bacterium]|jgi:mRNA interferase MazF